MQFGELPILKTSMIIGEEVLGPMQSSYVARSLPIICGVEKRS